MSESIPILQPIRRRWWRPTRGALVILGILGCLIGGCYAWRKHEYPYGWSHACDKGLYLALFNYADRHDGNFPAGEETPEASLSLFQRDEPGSDYASVLCGKRIPESKTKKVLDSGQLLGPDTCGWYYVEGLRKDDDPRLALFWDKDGLNHNGGRLPGGGHIVHFVNGDHPYIPVAKWPAFMSEQETLWQKLRDEGRMIQVSDASRTPSGAKP